MPWVCASAQPRCCSGRGERCGGRLCHHLFSLLVGAKTLCMCEVFTRGLLPVCCTLFPTRLLVVCQEVMHLFGVLCVPAANLVAGGWRAGSTVSLLLLSWWVGPCRARPACVRNADGCSNGFWALGLTWPQKGHTPSVLPAGVGVWCHRSGRLGTRSLLAQSNFISLLLWGIVVWACQPCGLHYALLACWCRLHSGLALTALINNFFPLASVCRLM